MAKNPFKVGDRVYVYPHGRGEVFGATKENVVISHNGTSEYVYPYQVVSFTEYDPIKGGLSHERIKSDLPKDEYGKYEPVWSPMQGMTIDAIGEKIQEHDRVLKGVSSAIDELKNAKVTAKIKLEDIWPIKPDFKKRFNSGGETGERVLTGEQSRYRSLIKDFMSGFDVVGFNAYDELYEAANKDGSLAPGIPTGRVTLSIDVVRRK